MNVRVAIAMLLLVFGIFGAVIGNSYVYQPHGGAFPGNPLAFGIFSVFLAVIGIVLLVSWMFSELTPKHPYAARSTVEAPAENYAMSDAGTEH